MILRLIRGGSFNYATRAQRTTRRYGDRPEVRYWGYGFRLIVRRQR